MVPSSKVLNDLKTIGHYIDDFREGIGELTLPDGTHYHGTFKASKRHGDGELKKANRERYEGQFKEDAMDGQGEYHYSIGDVYVGYWSSNQRNGVGRLTTRFGVEEGVWKNDKLVEPYN
jgi:hypothetical protein